jgi:hypothetical protein
LVSFAGQQHSTGKPITSQTDITLVFQTPSSSSLPLTEDFYFFQMTKSLDIEKES